MDEIPQRLGMVFDVDLVFAHGLEPADVAGMDVGPGGEFHALGLPGHDAGHVVEHATAGRLVHGHGPQFRRVGGHEVGGFAGAAPADGPVGLGIALAAGRAHADGPHVGLDHERRLHGHRGQQADMAGGGLDLGEKAFAVLFFFRLELEEPGVDFRPVLQMLGIDPGPIALAGELVVERERIAAEVDHPHPAVAVAWRGEDLHGVGQALLGFHHGVKKRSLGQHGPGGVHHVAADDEPGGGVAVEGGGDLEELFEGVRADGAVVRLEFCQI